MNVVVLTGALSSDPQIRELPSGSHMLSLEITTRLADGSAASVPVVWFDPATTALMSSGDVVAVLGCVRRRFFRTAAGATQSRTEVVAERVVPASQRRGVRGLLRNAADAIAGDLGPVSGERLRSP